MPHCIRIIKTFLFKLNERGDVKTEKAHKQDWNGIP